MSGSIEFLKVRLKSRSVLASGILGVTLASLKRVFSEGAGIVTTKSVGPERREGHHAPVVFDWGSGLINAVGLSNPGINHFIENYDNDCVDFPLIISIFGAEEGDFPVLAQKLKPLRFSFVELNLSCPNVLDEYGTPFSFSPEMTYRITRGVKDALDRPLIVKLSPNTPLLLRVAHSAQVAGADALCIMNTLGPGMVINVNTASPVLGNKTGGLSGEAILPVTVRNVYEVSEEISIPIVGMGGIGSADAALQVLMAGASLYGIGSAVYTKGLGIFRKIDDGIRDFMERNGIEDSGEIVGLAHRKKPHAFYHFHGRAIAADNSALSGASFSVVPVHAIEWVKNSMVKTILFRAQDLFEGREEHRNLDSSGEPRSGGSSPSPGQFYMLWIPGHDQKPYSVSYYDGECLGFSIIERGSFSSALFSLERGQPIGLLGPLGRSFHLYSDNYLLVGGGIGSAPLVFAALQLMKLGKKFRFFAGGKTAASVNWIKPLLERGGLKRAKVTFCTEDGSMGLAGMLTEHLEYTARDYQPGQALLCGPEVFIKRAIAILIKRGIQGEASIERMMKCGTGICGSCCIDPTGERVCVEGPVFPFDYLERLSEFGNYKRDSSGSTVQVE